MSGSSPRVLGASAPGFSLRAGGTSEGQEVEDPAALVVEQHDRELRVMRLAASIRRCRTRAPRRRSTAPPAHLRRRLRRKRSTRSRRCRSRPGCTARAAGRPAPARKSRCRDRHRGRHEQRRLPWNSTPNSAATAGSLQPLPRAPPRSPRRRARRRCATASVHRADRALSRRARRRSRMFAGRVEHRASTRNVAPARPRSVSHHVRRVLPGPSGSIAIGAYPKGQRARCAMASTLAGRPPSRQPRVVCSPANSGSRSRAS